MHMIMQMHHSKSEIRLFSIWGKCIVSVLQILQLESVWSALFCHIWYGTDSMDMVLCWTVPVGGVSGAAGMGAVTVGEGGGMSTAGRSCMVTWDLEAQNTVTLSIIICDHQVQWLLWGVSHSLH